MKIGLIRRGYSGSGGAEAYLKRLAGGLAEAGHTPVLIGTSDWPDADWPNGELFRAAPHISPVRFAGWACGAAAGCDATFSLERVPGCTIFRAGDGVHRAWLERRSNFESIWRRLFRRLNCKHRALLRLERGVFDPVRTRRIVVNSGMVRSEICSHFRFPADRIDLIRNGFDAPAASPGERGAVRSELGFGSGMSLALFAGTGWERKGLGDAIRATAGVPNLTLLVAGRGSWRHRIPEHVKFLGPVAEMNRLYRAADFFILPTIYDPFSNACLEALAGGLPVVTTSANGFAEVIDRGTTGSVVDAGDQIALAREVAFWAQREHSEAARPICSGAASAFSVAENTRQTIAVIERACRRS